AMENWDKYVAQVQAAAGEKSTSESSYSSSKSTQTSSKKSYATAVRSYTKTYYSSSRYGSLGIGDCWDNSAALYNQLTSSGTKARIVQYANRYVSNHRSVEVWNGNSWVDYDYSGYGWRYQPTAHSEATSIVIASNY
ncbi:MAG: peptidoglycan-binding protein, partial [Methanobacteriaceae archaeon]|nr:peptidoglycan-binding protein [Methanobacteriaceae archaeon]